MHNLFIVGNGFDLAHGMKTSYTDFIKNIVVQYLKNGNESVIGANRAFSSYDDFIVAVKSNNSANVFNLSIRNTNLMLCKLVRELSLQNWCDVERQYFALLSSIGDRNMASYQSVIKLHQDFAHIKKELENYLQNQRPENAVDGYKKIFELTNKNSLILNFNYTNTIESLYSNVIRGAKIIHIHGELSNVNNPIIFGYAANNEDNDLLVNKGNEYLRNIKKFAYNRTSNNSNLKEYLENNKEIYISILGHSLGMSDNLIINQILNHHNVKSIRVFYCENYENYFQCQTNMYRIMSNDSNFGKLVNFEDSCRMPQYSDSTEQTKAINTIVDRIKGEYEKIRPHFPVDLSGVYPKE